MWFLFFFFFLSFVVFFLFHFLPELRYARWVNASAAVSVPFFFPNPKETDLGFFFFFNRYAKRKIKWKVIRSQKKKKKRGREDERGGGNKNN